MSRSDSVICPVCKYSRQTRFSSGLPLSIHFRLLFFVGAVSALWTWKLIALHLPLWAIGEFIHSAQTREAVKCPRCDFDPILYKKDPLAARKIVESKLQLQLDSVKQQMRTTMFAAPQTSPAAPSTPESTASANKRENSNP
jgi:hypothetical protein